MTKRRTDVGKLTGYEYMPISTLRDWIRRARQVGDYSGAEIFEQAIQNKQVATPPVTDTRQKEVRDDRATV